MHPSLAALLTESVTHQSYTGQDAYGKPTYGTPVARPARVAYRVTILANEQGEERASTTVVYTDGNFAVTLRDKIVLPDGSAPAIQSIYSPTDPLKPGGPDHHEISL